MYDDIRLEDIPEDLIAIATFLGIDIFIEFCDKFGGNHFYLPSKKSVLRLSRNREIKRVYNGDNLKELADRFGISQMHIRKIMKER